MQNLSITVLATLVFICLVSTIEAKKIRASNACSVKTNTYYAISHYNGGNLGSQPNPSNPKAVPNVAHTIATFGDYERWSIRVHDNGPNVEKTFSIINKQNGYALSVQDASRAEYAPFVFTNYTGGMDQEFTLIPAVVGYACAIMSTHSKKYLTSTTAPTEPNNVYRPMSQASKTSGSPQAWLFSEIPCDPYPYQPYYVYHRLSGLKVGLEKGKDANAVPVKVLASSETGDNVQVQFVPLPGNKDLFTINSKQSDRNFVIDWKSPSMGVILWDSASSSLNQQFTVEKGSQGWCLFKDMQLTRFSAPAKNGSSYAAGSALVQQDFTHVLEEYFRLEPVGFLPDSMIPYRLLNRGTGKYMTVYSGGQTNGNPIAQATLDTGAKNQLFTFKRVLNKPNTYTLESKQSGQVVDAQVDDGKTSVYQWPSNGNINQQFKLVSSTPPGYFIIVKAIDINRALTPLGGSKAEVAGIMVDKFNATNLAQQWQLVEATY